MTDWRPVCRGAVGIEFSLCGFGWGRDLFHRYACLGLATVYVTAQPLPTFLAGLKAARDVLRGSK